MNPESLAIQASATSNEIQNKAESIWTEILPEDILSKLLGFYMACSREGRTARLCHEAS